MKSFQNNYIESIPITHNILQTIRLIGEYKGKQDLFKEQSPQLLNTLRQTAIIQSIESSNRIEGISAPLERIKAIAAEKTIPANRSEQEIAGYRNVLNTIHSSYEHITVSSNVVLQFHRDIYALTAIPSGKWKTTDNEIAEVYPDGSKVVRFKPLSAFETPSAMDKLHTLFETEINKSNVEPLLLIAAYILDFLCIHPFKDGNGRMSRLLTLLLLYKSGYEVGRFISLEKLIEDNKDSYYDVLNKSSQNWHEGKHNLIPWWEYFLGILLKAFKDFERRVGVITTTKGAKREMVFDVVNHLPKQFQFGDIEKACPGISRPTINRALTELRDLGKIKCIKSGRDAVWERI
ncbi:MAG: Fic family protein [Bacteroidetes bacterium]|nr:Fic family protein [Bacteroidota bacterium]MBU2585063.1 Fic family protein [Bacteroidota bacterium]